MMEEIEIDEQVEEESCCTRCENNSTVPNNTRVVMRYKDEVFPP
jgi:hypothetical protein